VAKPLREAAIEHAKEITQQQMADSLEKGRKGNTKKKKKVPAYLLEQGSPELSELGDSASFREEPIQVQLSAKEPSLEERRFADVIRLRLAYEHEIKMFADNDEFKDELAAAKTGWIKINSLYKKLLQARIDAADANVSRDATGSTSMKQSYRSAVENLAGPKKRRRMVIDDDEVSPQDSSSSTSRLQDGSYCVPIVDAEDGLEPEVAEAMRQFREMEEDAEDDADVV